VFLPAKIVPTDWLVSRFGRGGSEGTFLGRYA